MDLLTSVDEISALMANGLYLDHHVYEQMARAVTGPVARTPGWRGQRLDRQMQLELSVTAYTPPSGKPPVLAFGNTRLTIDDGPLEFIAHRRLLIADLHADLFPLGVGVYGYCFNEGTLKVHIERLANQYGSKVILTGHSLGGCMAQLAAMHLPRLVAGVVTFQAPGTVSSWIAHAYATQPPSAMEELQRSSYHYQVDGDDLIQQTGELHTPGQVVRVQFANGQLDTPALYYAHTAQLFSDFSQTRGSPLAIRALTQRLIAQVQTEMLGEPADEVRSLVNLALESLRQRIVPQLLAAEAGFDVAANLLIGPVADLFARSASDIRRYFQELLYCALWLYNVDRFRTDPQQNVHVDTFLPALRLDCQSLLTRGDVSHMVSQFANYMLHSRVAA